MNQRRQWVYKNDDVGLFPLHGKEKRAMKRFTSKLAWRAAVGLAALTGCATSFHDSAPAQEGFIYVVGSSENTAAVWLCPSGPGRGDCERIDVNE